MGPTAQALKDREELQKLVESHNRIVFFGGAGVSTESGIPDFRSADGLYAQKYGDVPPEEMISRTYFDRHPEQFFSFYFDRMVACDAQPNKAHRKLAQLEADGTLLAELEEPFYGAAPGQSLVCYAGGALLGGGVIDRAE